MIRRLLSLTLCASVGWPALGFGWGFDGHRRIASQVHEPFATNACLRGWLSGFDGTFTFQDRACDPDRWRQSDPADCQGDGGMGVCEWPHHYLDVDYAQPPESYPREWADVETTFGRYAVKNGEVPWRVEEMYAQLVSNFRSGDAAAAQSTIAYLAHYVSDAFSPLHDTKNTNPNGLHLRYESDMLAVGSNISAISQASRSYYGILGRADPRNQIFGAVLVGNPLATKLVADDAVAGGDATALFNSSKDMTAKRWGDALTLLASLIGSAWKDAGAPRLVGMSSGCDATVPQGEVVLAGYPLPASPITDAGAPDQVDAGDPGSSEPNRTAPHQGCGAQAVAGAALVALGLALGRRRS